MIYAPRLLLIGATGRNAGKTLMATAVIRRFSAMTPIVGAKVTTISERNGECPRGGKGCGVCSSVDGKFVITLEEKGTEEKDTQRLLAAGAEKVFWLRVLKDHLEEGARALLEQAGPDAWIVCESNSLRTVLEPGLFIMVSAQDAGSVKPSAVQVYDRIDVLAPFDGKSFAFDVSQIELREKGWALAPGYLERSQKPHDTV